MQASAAKASPSPDEESTSSTNFAAREEICTAVGIESPRSASGLLSRRGPRLKWLVLAALGLGLPTLSVSLLAGEREIDWPQFRGPGGQGHAGDVRLPVTWTETEGVVWKCTVPGLGHSSPVHDGQRIWMTAAARDGSIMGAIGIDGASGELTHTIPVFQPSMVERIHQDNSYASPTPVLSNGKLFVHFGTYGTAAIDPQTGELLWRNTDFTVEHQGGPGSSPVSFEDLLIITLDGADSQTVVALDQQNGQVRWERARSAPMPEQTNQHRAFSTPLIASTGSGFQLISPGANQCHAYDPQTGNELWHVRYVGYSNVPRPVVNRDTCFICTGFDSPQLWAVGLDGLGDVSETHVRWRARTAIPETPSPLLAGNTLFTISDKGVLSALEADTGKRRWIFRVGGNHSASPLYANGLVYLCSEEGEVKVLDPRSEPPQVLGTNQMEGRIMSSPAVYGEDLLIRTDQALYRIHGTELEAAPVGDDGVGQEPRENS